MRRQVKSFWTELKRICFAVFLVVQWLIVWGIDDSAKTISLLVGFVSVGAIIGYFFSKEIFSKYKWDVGTKLNEAWESRQISHAILAASMLLARVLVYIVPMIVIALIINILRGGTW